MDSSSEERDQAVAVDNGGVLEMTFARVRGDRLDVAIPELQLAQCDGDVLDMVYLAHNAIRKEAMDMFYLVAFVQRRGHESLIADFANLFRWFHTFGEFVTDYFAFEQECLFPWLAAVEIPVHDDKVLNSSTRASVHKKHKSLLRKIYRLEGKAEGKVPTEVSSQFISLSEKLASSLANYCAHQEAVLEPRTRELTKEHKEQLETRTSHFLQALRNPSLFIAALARPLEDGRALHDLTRSLLRHANPLIRPSLKLRFLRGQHVFQTRHLDVAKEYFAKWVNATD